MQRLLLLLLLPAFCFGQDQLPTKDGKVIFEELDSVPGIAKADLYARSKVWVTHIFKNSKDVIQLDDKDAGQIIGKGNFDYQYVVIGPPGATWTCDFTLQIDCRDNKARIRIYELNTHCRGEASAEYVNDHHEKKHIRPIYSNCAGMLASFKSAMNKPADIF